MTAAITAGSLGKRYQIGERQYPTLRDQLTTLLVRMPVRAMKRSDGARKRKLAEVWALRDVDLEVQPGEVVGLIGRNGAGKSTLLRILSRVTAPTKGWAEVRGRMSSLLEVGTGFHPELTGRENVFLNGAILGMSKREMERKFDEIVAFAEVEKFIDTPVKHYSSGMSVRLAFAVAAHLEPEILLIDEVLAVGDAAFQKKCLGKMGQVSRGGRTILFVSHNMAAVKTLCTRGIFLKDGTVAASGDIATVVGDYLRTVLSRTNGREWRGTSSIAGHEDIRLSYASITPPDGCAEINVDTGAEIEIGLDNLLENANLGFTVYVTNHEGVLMFESGRVLSSDNDSRRGLYHFKGRIPANVLNAGHYSVDVLVGKDQRYPLFRIDNIVSFEVEHTTTGRFSNMSVARGVVRPLLSWELSFEDKSSGGEGRTAVRQRAHDREHAESRDN